jgi:hypothetical protein
MPFARYLSIQMRQPTQKGSSIKIFTRMGAVGKVKISKRMGKGAVGRSWRTPGFDILL